MQEKSQSRTAPDSPKSAARFVRRGAASIRAGAEGLCQYRAEYQSLIDWADQTGRRLPFRFIEQFDFVGEGAEHRDRRGTDGSDRLIVHCIGQATTYRRVIVE